MSQSRETIVRTIYSPVSGFLKDAGFTHSLSPARNCTYGCTYCYVPTMRIYGGLKAEDWQRWGQFTTFKTNSAHLIDAAAERDRIVFCSPLVDPYQPAEHDRALIPDVLRALVEKPPRLFALQTRSPLVLRDLKLLEQLSGRTMLRISFSITTDREDVRKRYEPHCDPIKARLLAIKQLREAGLEVYAALAPLLPCDPLALAQIALEHTTTGIIADPLHGRETKTRGATTRDAAIRIAEHWGEVKWFEAAFQAEVLDTLKTAVTACGRKLRTGPEGFKMLVEGG